MSGCSLKLIIDASNERRLHVAPEQQELDSTRKQSALHERSVAHSCRLTYGGFDAHGPEHSSRKRRRNPTLIVLHDKMSHGIGGCPMTETYDLHIAKGIDKTH